MTSTTRIRKLQLTAEDLADLNGFVVNGEIPEPAEVMAHNRPVLASTTAFGAQVQTWDQLDDNLKSFAHMAVAARIGCSWCLDLNYFFAQYTGIDEVKASEVPRWRESSVFSSLERDVMEYAEAMSATPMTVTDEMFSNLLEQLGEAAMIELTAVIGFANLTTRGNVAMGIESQGFSKDCKLPLAQPSAGYAASA